MEGLLWLAPSAETNHYLPKLKLNRSTLEQILCRKTEKKDCLIPIISLKECLLLLLRLSALAPPPSSSPSMGLLTQRPSLHTKGR